MSTDQKKLDDAIKIAREVASQAEVLYSDATRLGDHAARAFGGEERRRSQMTGLETIANSTFKTTDIFDYVKKQTARHKGWQHREGEGGERFGERLLQQLQGELANRARAIADRLRIGDTTDEDKQKRRHIHLLLMRQFIRQMVVQYEYKAELDKGRRGGR